MLTPKRPEATCLIALRFESPLGRGLNLAGSSPPSPVLDLAAEPVHGYGHGLVGCSGYAAETHGAGRKSFHDL